MKASRLVRVCVWALLVVLGATEAFAFQGTIVVRCRENHYDGCAGTEVGYAGVVVTLTPSTGMSGSNLTQTTGATGDVVFFVEIDDGLGSGSGDITVSQSCHTWVDLWLDDAPGTGCGTWNGNPIFVNLNTFDSYDEVIISGDPSSPGFYDISGDVMDPSGALLDCFDVTATSGISGFDPIQVDPRPQFNDWFARVPCGWNGTIQVSQEGYTFNSITIPRTTSNNSTYDITASGYGPVPSFQLTAPVGVPELQSGSSFVVEWSDCGIGQYTLDSCCGILEYDVQFSSNGGSSWSTVVCCLQEDITEYNWSVPYTESANCKLRVLAFRAGTGNDLVAESATFAIVKSFSDQTPTDPADLATTPFFGAAWIDYSNGGFSGLFTTTDGDPGQIRVFVPQSGLNWEDWTDELNLNSYSGDPRGIAVADYNNDGYLDFYVTACDTDNKLFKNVGGTHFVEQSPSPGHDGCAESAAWGDYNNDGSIDLYVTYSTPSGPPSKKKNALYRNSGPPNYTFSEVSLSVLQIVDPSLGAAWGDYDNDGDLDLFVTTLNAPDRLIRNNSPGFSEITGVGLRETSSLSSGAVWADIDFDNNLELFVANGHSGPSGELNAMYYNNGDGTFSELGAGIGAQTSLPRSIAVLDLDGDRLIELYSASRDGDNQLYEKSITGNSFQPVYTHPELITSGISYAMTWGDIDSDGDPDVFLGDRDPSSPSTGQNRLLINDAGDNATWLRLALVTHSDEVTNKAAIGARVEVRNGTLSQYREVSGGGALYSQNTFLTEFGVPGTTVTEVVVQWPSGRTTELTNVSTASVVNVLEPNPDPPSGGGCPKCDPPAQASIEGPTATRIQGIQPNPFNPATVVRYDLSGPGDVDIVIFDVAGRRVLSHRIASQSAGRFRWQWNGRDGGGNNVSGGIYYVVLKVNGVQVDTRKAVLLK